jgi:hypothetical protein
MKCLILFGRAPWSKVDPAITKFVTELMTKFVTVDQQVVLSPHKPWDSINHTFLADGAATDN